MAKIIAKNFTALSARLKTIRGSMNTYEAERRWGVKRQNIERYESGEVMPGGDNLAKIANAENVNINWLLGVESGPIYRGTGRPADSVSPDETKLLHELKKEGIFDIEQLRVILNLYRQFSRVVAKVNEEMPVGNRYRAKKEK